MGRLGTVLAGVLLVCCPCALALNPSLNVSQYAHTAWKVRDGFSKGVDGLHAMGVNGCLQ